MLAIALMHLWRETLHDVVIAVTWVSLHDIVNDFALVTRSAVAMKVTVSNLVIAAGRRQ